MEQSFIMIKPDGVQRGLVGEIISRFEKKGFALKGLGYPFLALRLIIFGAEFGSSPT
ncbi:Nucleoside diphosphate kinase 1, partial [Cucurbita argyrosperma subsp. argyrosperma]